MHCPKCGTENTDEAKSCCSCGQDLVTTPFATQKSGAKTCALAIISLTLSLTLGIFGIVLFPLFIASDIPTPSLFVVLFTGITAITAIILGIMALQEIKVNKGVLKGRGLAIAGIAIQPAWLVILLFIRLISYHPPPVHPWQKAQFISIEAALELFNSEFDGYPPSEALDENGKHYCGAMKLSEAMMGQDLLGFHSDSVFRSNGTDGKGTILYPDANDLSEEAYRENLSVRRGPYLPLENVNPCRLKDLYKNVGPFNGNIYVLCDVYSKKRETGKRTGMPVLYYKANTSKTAHDINDPNNPENIYDYRDNHALLALGVPGKPDQKHPLFENPKIFYEIVRNERIAGPSLPHRADAYILLSAGLDGLYGTKDDVANFEMRWKSK